jgi:hypothetical protein
MLGRTRLLLVQSLQNILPHLQAQHSMASHGSSRISLTAWWRPEASIGPLKRPLPGVPTAVVAPYKERELLATLAALVHLTVVLPPCCSCWGGLPWVWITLVKTSAQKLAHAHIIAADGSETGPGPRADVGRGEPSPRAHVSYVSRGELSPGADVAGVSLVR